MEISNAHHKAMDSHQLEEVLSCSNKLTQQQQQQQERKVRPHPVQALKCPRCASTNTKFCYYNNYSLSQPRYFCKGCRRYWTQGGSLRNVPVGGSCRKNKRPSSSSAPKQADESSLHIHAINSNLLLPALIPPTLSHDPNDLTLAFACLQQPTKQFGLQDGHDQSVVFGHANDEPILTAPINGFLDILRSGFIDTAASTSPFNSFYYGFDTKCNGVDVGSVAGVEGGVLPSEYTGFVSTTGSTVTSQGSTKDMDEGEAKVLMGLPWQVAAGSGSIAVETGRDSWSGVNSWHGLVNSALI